MLICSPEEHLLRKIWVWFRAVRFVMCRQPQQKSGSKQPWSNWYDHQTEEAMPLVRTGKGEGKGGRKGWGFSYGLHLPSAKAGEMPLPDVFRRQGKQLDGHA